MKKNKSLNQLIENSLDKLPLVFRKCKILNTKSSLKFTEKYYKPISRF